MQAAKIEDRRSVWEGSCIRIRPGYSDSDLSSQDLVGKRVKDGAIRVATVVASSPQHDSISISNLSTIPIPINCCPSFLNLVVVM
jgi:hypothetical protein